MLKNKAGGILKAAAAYGYADKVAVGPLYTGRRVWRVFDVLAPSLRLDARLGSFSQYPTYPFSVKPEIRVSINTIMELLRDHYEGTPYDMTKGIAAGPFGSPVRWGGDAQGIIGGWERPISMYRTLFSFVLQSRSFLPDSVGGVAWYGQGSPHGSVYVPFSCRQQEIPHSYLIGKQSEFNPESAWWAFDFVNNWSLLRFNLINQDVREQINKLQTEAFKIRIAWEAHAMNELGDDHARDKYLQVKSNVFASRVVSHWWEFAWKLVAKYSDGYITTGESPEQMKAPGYPAWWLQLSEFSRWPGDTFKPLPQMEALLQSISSEYALHHSIGTTPRESGLYVALMWMAIGGVLGVIFHAYSTRQRRHGYKLVR